MNKVILLGNLTRDVELRYTTSNVTVGKFGLAVKEEVKNKEGNYNTNFLNCVAYGQLAETINKYFKKGSRILVEGRIQTGSYEKDDGTKVNTTDIVVEKINFVDSKKETKEEPTEEKTDAEIIASVVNNPYEEMGNKIQQEEIDLPF